MMNSFRTVVTCLGRLTSLESSFNNLRITAPQRCFATAQKVGKKPPSPFILFYQEKLPEIRASATGSKVTQWSKTAGQMWKALDESGKKPYQTEFEAQKKTYLSTVTADELAARKAAISTKRAKTAKRRHKQEAKKLDKPKRPPTSLGLFIRAKSSELSQKNMKPVFSQLAHSWKGLPESEKQQYIKDAETQKLAYNKELNKWEDKMIADGKRHLVRTSRLKELEAKPKKTKK